jgi:hypothetical protein
MTDTPLERWRMHLAQATTRDDEPPVERGDVVTVTATDSLTGQNLGPDGYCMVVDVSMQETFPFPDDTGWEATIRALGTSQRVESATYGCSNLDPADGPVCSECGQRCGCTNAGDGFMSHCCGRVCLPERISAHDCDGGAV